MVRFLKLIVLYNYILMFNLDIISFASAVKRDQHIKERHCGLLKMLFAIS